MEKAKSPLIVLLSLAIAGNLLFILWILYNAAKEGFQGTLPEKVSALTLIALLATNTFLLLRSRGNNK